MRSLPDGRGGVREYLCAAQHELCVARSSLRGFAEAVGFLVVEKQDRLAAHLSGYTKGPYGDRAFATVANVDLVDEEEVYDLTEPDTAHFLANGLWVHNCGEQPLLPFESCVLGSVNLARFARYGGREGDVEWDRLRGAIRDGVHFLDNLIDVTVHPLPQIEAITRANRKIGLGVMGLADLFVALGIPYDSDDALALAERIADTLETESVAMSEQLAAARGAFPNWGISRWADSRELRNATTTTVAPTGTISILAGCSSGIEPLYAVAYERRILDGEVLFELHPQFRADAERLGFWSDDLAARVAQRGRVRGLDEVPAEVQAVYATAHDVSPERHIRMQAVFQRRSHSGVSKTVNLQRDATPDDVAAVFRLAYEAGCKGVTVYRDGSRDAQVLAYGAQPPADKADQCPECAGPLRRTGVCTACRSCGYSACE